ncbi:MAG: hypothetical protein GEV09_17235 [Pseudonocardiaceae bacterium]|nr:hypothetical protein [Pseudonocardiaceae bacterium]
MNEDRRIAGLPDDLPNGDEQAAASWSVEEQTALDAGECTHVICKNVEVNVGYQGLADGSALSQSAAVSDDLRAAWKTKLEDEGKLDSGTKTVGDVIFGSGEPK